MNLHSKDTFKRAYRDRTWDFYRSLLAECVRYGQPGHWLDLGAGTGLFTECATRYGMRCTGLEGSSDGVEIAKARYPRLDIRVHLLEQPLPFPDKSVSSVICNQIIEHVEPAIVEHMFKEALRVLVPKGVMFVYSPCKYDSAQRKEETHINLYAPAELEKLIEKSGFRIITTPNAPITYFGKSRMGSLLMKIAFKISPIDFFSATSNCIAIKD